MALAFGGPAERLLIFTSTDSPPPAGEVKTKIKNKVKNKVKTKTKDQNRGLRNPGPQG